MTQRDSHGTGQADTIQRDLHDTGQADMTQERLA